MIYTILYWAYKMIVTFLFVTSSIVLFKTERFQEQIMTAFLVAVLLLRVLSIK